LLRQASVTHTVLVTWRSLLQSVASAKMSGLTLSSTVALFKNKLSAVILHGVGSPFSIRLTIASVTHLFLLRCSMDLCLSISFNKGVPSLNCNICFVSTFVSCILRCNMDAIVRAI